jgi:aspartate/methionine/tyrosine aminotransferase
MGCVVPCDVCCTAGKTFSVTGWKIGWCIAPPHLSRCLAIAHQWDVFSVSSTSQVAVARALETAEQPYEGCKSYYEWLNKFYRAKRTRLADALAAGGIVPIVCVSALRFACPPPHLNGCVVCRCRRAGSLLWATRAV